jgi:choline dehydrogenase-like flavoprotein
MFVDATQLEDDTQLDCDICIIGAGPAGIVLAHGLAEAGLRICLTEAGGLSPESEHPILSLAEQLGYPIVVNPGTKYFGGMTNAWGGMRSLYVRLLPFDPIDFEARSWVPHSGWPITYREFKPFYEGACNVMNGIPRNGFDVEGHRKWFLPAFNDEVLRSNLSYLVRPIRFGKRYRESLGQAPNVRVLLNSCATEIEESRSERTVNVIHARARNGRKHRFAAGTFVLACGGLETTRLLLASKGKHAAGVGNQHDLVGRFYMQHPKGSHGHMALRRHTHPHGYVKGFEVEGRLLQACVAFAEERQRREGLLNHRADLAPILQLTESRAARLYSQLRANWREGRRGRALRRGAAAAAIDMPQMTGATCKSILRSLPQGSLHYRLINHLEQVPDPESRIMLAGTTDRYGVPELRTDWRINAEEKRSLCRLHELIGDNLRRYKIGSLQSRLDSEMDIWPIASSSSHDLGTARMHDNPRRGVTNAEGRVHSVENLYVVGGALFPTGSNANSTLTIIALALRMVSHLATRAKATPIEITRKNSAAYSPKTSSQII